MPVLLFDSTSQQLMSPLRLMCPALSLLLAMQLDMHLLATGVGIQSSLMTKAPQGCLQKAQQERYFTEQLGVMSADLQM